MAKRKKQRRRLAGNSRSSQPKKRRQGGKGKPFKPDDPRINRTGISDECIEFQRRLRKAFAAELDRPSELDPEKKQTKFDRIVEKIVLAAQGGSLEAAGMIFDRTGGKPIQPHEVGGIDGEPIQHMHTIRFGDGVRDR